MPTSSGERPFRLVDIGFLLVAAVLFLVIFRNAVPHMPFVYDEADYVTVGRDGFWANYAEPRSLSLPGFIGLGLKAMHGEIGRGGLSDYVRDSHDTGFLRHYHGPLYYHWLDLAHGASGGSEYGVRLSGLICHLLAFATIVLGVPWAMGTEYRPAGWLGGALYLFSLNNILTGTELSSHVLFMWVSILGLILIARFGNVSTRENYYRALVAAAVALCTLEYGVLLFACLALAVYLRRQEFLPRWAELPRLLLISAGVTLGVILLLWPAGLLKGTMVEGFLFIGYLTKFRPGSFGTETPGTVWIKRLEGEPADCLVLAFCLVMIAVFIWRSPRRNALLPLVLYPLLMLITTLKNTAESARYFSSIPAPLITAGAVLLFERMRNVPSAIFAGGTAVAAGILAFAAYQPAMLRGANTDSTLSALLEKSGQESAHKILVPFLYRPPMAYYYPDRAILSFAPKTAKPELVSEIERSNPDMACVYGWQALPGRIAARIGGPEGELICSVRK